uniref:AAA+ ATPase At3g28540-like C-terminal domain-containing protein n=1 Tax=Aegilops tauschii subsp. strangulata TaxID=200361 RepID=A0A453MKT7_AEGTS
RLRDRALKIFLNESSSWRGINHHHPATFDTLAMDPAMKQAVMADLDRFLKRKEYYRRIGKAWKRGYLLYGPPGTGKSSLVAAMANYLRFNLYDLDLSGIQQLLAAVEVTPAEVSEMLLRSEDVDAALRVLMEFLKARRSKTNDKQNDGI